MPLDLSKLSDSDLQAVASGDMSKMSDEGLNQYVQAHDQLEKDQYVNAMKQGGQATLEHAGNAATLGYLPHLQAAAEPLETKILDLFTGNNVSDTDNTSYVHKRDQNIARLKQEEKDNPVASGAGTIAGGLAGGAAMSAALPITAASVPMRALQAARAGAAIGAISNPGDTQGQVNGPQLSDRAKRAAIDAAVSVPLQLGAEAVGKAGEWASDKLSGAAERRAFKALGPYQRDVLQNPDDIQDIGRAALDKGVITNVPSNYETLASRAEAAKDQAGQDIGRIVDELSSNPDAPTLSRSEIANNLRQKLYSDPGVPGTIQNNSKLKGLIDEFENGPGAGSAMQSDALPLDQARALKKGVSDEINWKRLPGSDIPVEEKFYRGLYGELKNGEEGIAESLANQGKIPNSDEFINAKQDYGNLSRAADISSKRASKEFANRTLGLTDTVAGVGGAGVGSYLGHTLMGPEGAKVGFWAGGAIGAAANKLARTYGNQVAAKAADNMSNLLAQSPILRDIVSSNPALVPVLMNSTIDKSQQKQDNENTSRYLGSK